MSDEELLQLAERAQSFDPRSGNRNEYNGLDKMAVGNIQDTRIYALVHDGNLADLKKGKALKIEYFFDRATYDKYVDPVTGKFDSKALSEALQVKPYQSPDMAVTDGHAEYRNSIACFDRRGDIRTPVGYCEANTQFGGGGAHQAFIPSSESKALQEKGILKYNAEASNIHTGTNYSIGADEYGKIQSVSDERCQNCEDKNLQHPEPEACTGGFAPNPRINGTSFNATGISDTREKSDSVGSGPQKTTGDERSQRNLEAPSGQAQHSNIVDFASAFLYAYVIDIVVSIEEEEPPLLFNLTDLQAEANRRYGLTAAETLACIQHIYEGGGGSYPRTSSRHITADMEKKVSSLLSD